MAGALIRRPTPPDRADLRVYVGLQLAIMTALASAAVLVTLPFGRLRRDHGDHGCGDPKLVFRGAGVVTIERQLLYRKLATAETSELLVYYVWTVATVALGWGVWGLATAVVMRSIGRNTRKRLRAGADPIRLAVVRESASACSARHRRARPGGRSRLRSSGPGFGHRHGGARRALRRRVLQRRASSTTGAEAPHRHTAPALASRRCPRCRRPMETPSGCSHGSCRRPRSSSAFCWRRSAGQRRRSSRSCSESNGRRPATSSPWFVWAWS